MGSSDFPELNLGDCLGQIRQRRGLSQQQLAARLGCEISSIQALESGYVDCTLAIAARLSLILNVSFEELRHVEEWDVHIGSRLALDSFARRMKLRDARVEELAVLAFQQEARSLLVRLEEDWNRLHNAPQQVELMAFSIDAPHAAPELQLPSIASPVSVASEFASDVAQHSPVEGKAEVDHVTEQFVEGQKSFWDGYFCEAAQRDCSGLNCVCFKFR